MVRYFNKIGRQALIRKIDQFSIDASLRCAYDMKVIMIIINR
ncbi:hypothetical protein J2Z69_003215 [Paenibacillus shirakamiensis]|uniref:Uncharacterized protein n=1 Tax=Paenibacillus shirakamiensis TaxID=1265935 RepID=A0ABS4JKD7_9BACL|nr:hypothetical protein [Paenibacillus shirakamiensis]